MPQNVYTVTQIREVQVEAANRESALKLASRAFYGNKPAKADPSGTVLSAVLIKDLSTREGV